MTEFDTKMAEARAAIRVLNEPHTYEPWERHSFFLDLARSTLVHDEDAIHRLSRHQHETRVDSGQLETRINPDTTLGFGGEFTPPAWLIEKFKTAARAGRPFADLIGSMPTPSGVQQINIPKISVGFKESLQEAQGDAEADTDATSSALNSPVVTIAGAADYSQQLQDLSPIGFDAAAYQDLKLDYNVRLETQLLFGNGLSGELTGLNSFTLPAASTISGASVTGVGGTTTASFWYLLGSAFAQVGNGRLMPPEAFLMAPRRWAWLAASQDSSLRPIASPGGAAFHVEAPQAMFKGGTMPFGPALGLPIYVDGVLPAGTGVDQVWCIRPSDMFLWESNDHVACLLQPLAGTLQVRLRLYKYVAFIGNTYTTSMSTIINLPAVTNY